MQYMGNDMCLIIMSLIPAVKLALLSLMPVHR